MTEPTPAAAAPVEDRPTLFGRLCVFLLMMCSASITGFLIYLVWDHIALISAMVIAGVITAAGFEVWEEDHPRLE